MLATKVEVDGECYSGRRNVKDAKIVLRVFGRHQYTCCFQLLAYNITVQLPFGLHFLFFMMVGRFSFFVRVLLAFYTSLAAAKAAQEPLVQQGYRVGEKIPVSCLNRTMYVCAIALRVYLHLC
jgi:hypothetical protein